MVTKLLSCSFIGIDASTVEIEVDMRTGSLPSIVIVGLPDTAAVHRPGGGRDDEPGHVAARAGPGTVERRLRGAQRAS